MPRPQRGSATGRVKVIRRNLKYPRDWPDTPAREKGVDVALAVDFVRMSMLKECDIAILFSVDADQLTDPSTSPRPGQRRSPRLYGRARTEQRGWARLRWRAAG